MKRPATGGLGDLFAAAEAVGHDERIAGSVPYAGQQPLLADCLRDVVVVAFETERPRHTAAAGVENLIVESHTIEYAPVGVHAEDRLVMTVAVDKRFTLKRQGRQAIRV